MAFFIKQNDTAPILQADLKDANNTAVDVTGATITFKMRPVSSTTATINSSATIIDGEAGSVKYEWVSGDTATAGSYFAEFQVVFSGGRIETFPNGDYIQITILDDIA